MDWDVYLRTVFALIAVLGLIGATAWVAKRIGFGGVAIGPRRKRRLAVVESVPLDGRRRLVLVRRDEVEHLLLIGGGADIVVERGTGVVPRLDQPEPVKEDLER